MRRRRLHGTDVELTEIGFGSSGLGNLYRAIGDDDASSAVEAAWAGGVRYFDTAPHYGLGLAERRLGRALSSKPRDQFVVSTKVGRLLVPNERPTARDSGMFDVPGDLRREWDFSRDGILRSLEGSLDRLSVDRVDIVFLHDPEVSGDPAAAETGVRTLVELRDQGVVAAIGIGSNDTATVVDLFTRSDIDVAMLAGRYTLLEQNADAVFEAAGDRSIIAAGVFNSGILSTPEQSGTAMFDYGPAPDEIVARAQRLRRIVQAENVTLPQAAIAFPLLNPRVASVALGMRNSREVDENLGSYRASLPASLWHAIHANTYHG